METRGYCQRAQALTLISSVVVLFAGLTLPGLQGRKSLLGRHAELGLHTDRGSLLLTRWFADGLPPDTRGHTRERPNPTLTLTNVEPGPRGREIAAFAAGVVRRSEGGPVHTA